MSDHYVTRRDFLQASTLAVAAGALTAARGSASVPPLRFGLVTDIHYADIEPAGIKRYRDSAAKLAECVRFMNEQKVDFLAELGDFKDQGKPPDEKVTLGYLETIERAFTGFKGPRYHVLGNHDVDSISKRQFLEATTEASRRRSLGYYDFRSKDVTFLVLDACFRADGADYDHGNYAWEDANVPAPQLEWLDAALTRAPGPVIVFVHQQLDGEGAYFVKNAAAVRAALERPKKVLAVFQGHRHEGGYSRINGIHYYTLKAMVDSPGPDNTSYAIVEADSAFNLTVTGYRRAESRGLPRG